MKPEKKRNKQHLLLTGFGCFSKRNTQKQDTITLQGTSDEKIASSAGDTSNSQEITCHRLFILWHHVPA
jgi:hypothetical protein